MSHVTTVKLKLRHLADIRAAAEAVGMEFGEGVTRFRSYAGENPCAHVVRLPDEDAQAWQIGLVAAADGDGYEARWDTWGPRGQALVNAAGREMSRLRQEYAAANALRTARKKLAGEGFVLAKREALPDGRIRLRLVRR